MISRKSLLAKYNKFENDNNHNACAILLVKHFGTHEELEILENIKKSHNKRGYILQEEIDVRRNISQKYYKLLTDEQDNLISI